MYVCMYVCNVECMYVRCMYVCMYMYVCKIEYIRVFKYVCMYVYIYAENFLKMSFLDFWESSVNQFSRP